MYIIERIVNNNIVISKDEKGEEIILRGLGIGFGLKKGESIPSDKIEKIYKMSNNTVSNKLEELLANIPNDQIKTSTEIIDYACKVIPKKISENIMITLTDHINFALQRHEMNMDFKNPLLWEIKRFYPLEFQVATEGLAIIEKNLKVKLNEDEAGFIALHIVNAELGTDMGNTVQITEMIQDILNVISEYYECQIDDTSIHYERFVTHLKFLGQRLLEDKKITSTDEDADLCNIVYSKYPNEFNCAKKIEDMVLTKYKKTFQKNEKMYLTIHLRRIIMSLREN